MDWIECQDCSEEFKIISPSTETIGYCPFCGSEVELEDEDLDDEEEY